MRVNKQAHDAAAISGVDIIESSVIYELLDQFKTRKAKFLAQSRLQMASTPCVLAINPEYIVKEYDPIILGVTCLLGEFGVGTKLYLLDGMVPPLFILLLPK